MTLVSGAGGNGLAGHCEEYVADKHAHVDVVVYDGGQERYPLSRGGVGRDRPRLARRPRCSVAQTKQSKAKKLTEGLGLRTVGDLLHHFPRRYVRTG